MIEVTYYREHSRVTVKGHAHSDEPGKDLVCAGVSALAFTLAENVGHMQQSGYVRDVTVKMDPGDCEIACRPKGKYTATVRMILEAVIVGFELLAANTPEYITYEIHG